MAFHLKNTSVCSGIQHAGDNSGSGVTGERLLITVPESSHKAKLHVIKNDWHTKQEALPGNKLKEMDYLREWWRREEVYLYKTKIGALSNLQDSFECKIQPGSCKQSCDWYFCFYMPTCELRLGVKKSKCNF